MIHDFRKTAIMAGEHNISYTELNQRIEHFSTFTPKGEQTKTIIFSENRRGWIYAFFSVWNNDGIAVPVDAASTVHDVAYILSDCHPDCVWASAERAEIVREAMDESGVQIPLMIIDEYEDAQLPETITQSDIQARDITREKSSEVALIIYTSGTTGSPKGVMLTYANLWANMAGVSDEVKIYDEHRRTIILLPIHHVLPLMGTMIIPILKGAGVIICPTMSGPDIMECLCRGQVGIFVGVPRLWQTLYTGIKKKIDSSAVTRALFKICEKANNRALSRFVFQSVRKKMGGHIDFCVSGGAALDKEIGQGLRTIGLDVLEGYGMTETAPIISFTRPGDIIPGCAGLPLPSVQCKIVDTEGRPAAEGELCAKGPNLMKGYYNRPEETAAVIDSDGYIHTGDLARFDEKGRVYITGRSKEIIVLSNGKNVQPNEIEFKLEKYDTRVKEAAVVQDGDMLRGIIVPQPAWAADMTDREVEEALKREVIEPYNLSVSNYKKLMSIFVYRDDLPRTKLDKLQRFKLKALIENGNKDNTPTADVAEEEPEMQMPEYVALKNYIEQEKHQKVKASFHLETDLAFDSLDKVGLESFIEQTFGINLPADMLASAASVGEIAEYVAREKTRMDIGTIDWHQIITTAQSQQPLPTTSPLFPLHAKAFKVFHMLYNRISVKGKENVPAKGPYIIAPNHQSFIDGPLAMAGMSMREIAQCYFYATEEHVKQSLLKKLAQRNNIILMERRNLKNSILKLAEVLRQGKNIVIFPEGSRTHDGKLDDFKKTFAILSKELGCPVVPVCIKGAYEALPRGTHFMKPTKISVEYLPAIQPVESDTYDSLSNKVREAILDCLEK